MARVGEKAPNDANQEKPSPEPPEPPPSLSGDEATTTKKAPSDAEKNTPQQKENRKKSRKEKEKEAAEEIVQSGRKFLAEMDASPFFSSHPPSIFPDFETSELKLGKELGWGSFCEVYEIVAMAIDAPKKEQAQEPGTAEGRVANGVESGSKRNGGDKGGNRNDNGEAAEDGGEETAPTEQTGANGVDGETARRKDDDFESDFDHNNNDKHNDDQHQRHYDMIPSVAKRYMSGQCLRDGTDARYAIKRLRTDLDSHFQVAKGIVDLALESKFLSSVSHPNIIKMRGRASGDPLDVSFFIVMDRLYDTLETRIEHWDAQKTMESGGSGGCLGCIASKSDKEALRMLMSERLTVAYDIASVFRYLHEKKLVYRDIKPDNMGFDVRGDIKVFDFGLCKELTPSLRCKDSSPPGLTLYNLTGVTGSRRYMAPEVVLRRPYNQTADVFSYGILLWQILSLKVPFESFDQRDHTEKVALSGYRPPISTSWPVLTRGLMKECWSADIAARPDFYRIASVVKGDMMLMSERGGNKEGSLANRTRHMMSKSQRSLRLNGKLAGLESEET